MIWYCTNGIYVNGRFVAQTPLHHNTELNIGAYTLTILVPHPNPPKCSNPACGREKLIATDSSQRDVPLDMWGGTTTADRPDWRQMIE